MARVYKIFNSRNTRQSVATGLVFFLVVLASCSNKKAGGIEIEFTNERASGLIFPVESANDLVSVQLAEGTSKLSILGESKVMDGLAHFRPLIPLTPGLTYQVFVGETLLGSVTIPKSKSKAPSLLAVYPSRDTLPENLLKFYFKFSQPMKAGESGKFIHLLNSKKDTLDDVFLDLQPELWDTSGTVLTLWLDPGRIKRELEPNLRLGNPLKKGEIYSLIVSSDWKNLTGKPLARSFVKTFTVGARDNNSPVMGNWKLVLPKAESSKPLQIQFPEPMDHFLLQESFSVRNVAGKSVEIKITIGDDDQSIAVIPNKNWGAGTYTIRAESRLEDLAGNNLARPFDRDLLKKYDKPVFERKFCLTPNPSPRGRGK